MTVQLPRASRIYISGYRGLVGSTLVNCLQQAGFTEILTATRAELDRLHQLGWRHQHHLRESLAATYDWFLGNGGFQPPHDLKNGG